MDCPPLLTTKLVTVDEIVPGTFTAAFAAARLTLLRARLKEWQAQDCCDDPSVVDLQVYGDGAKDADDRARASGCSIVSDTMQSFQQLACSKGSDASPPP